MPAAAQQETFRNVLAESVGDACSLPVVRAVRAQICQAVEDHKASKEPEPLTVDKYALRDMLGFGGVPEEGINAFEEKFDRSFGGPRPQPPQSGGYTQIRGQNARCRDPRQSGASRAGRDPHHRRRKVHSHPRR